MATHATQLISIIRRPGEVFALIRMRTAHGGSAASFETKSVPLEQVTRAMFPAKDRFQESWHRLSQISVADEETLLHIFIVLLESVPDFSSEKKADPWPADWGAQPTAPRATAAHPRAFKGTKHRPPKSSGFPRFDLRPYLCDSGSIQALMTPLWKHAPRVRKRLEKAGCSAIALDAVEDQLRADPGRKGLWSLPARFVQYFWLDLRQQSRREASRFLRLFVDLELERDERLLDAMSRILTVADCDRACAWGRVCEVVPSNRRAAFIERVIQSKAFNSPPTPGMLECVREASLLATDERFTFWIGLLLRAERRGAQARDFLAAGLRLAAQFDPKHAFPEAGECADFPEREVEEIVIQLADHSSYGWMALALWQRCGRLPGFAGLIVRSGWREFEPDAARAYFDLLTGVVYCDLPERAIQRKWLEIAAEIPRIECFILATPRPQQRAAVDSIEEWLRWWDRPGEIRGRLPAGCGLLRRLIASSTRPIDAAAGAIRHFLETDREVDLERFLDAPIGKFEALAQACRRDNDAGLIARGLGTLIRHLGSFTVSAFLEAPKTLVRVAKALGSVGHPVRSQIIQACGEHAFFRIDPATAPLREVCEAIAALRTDRQSNPIPARLSQWMRREIDLSPSRLARYQRVLAEGFLLTRLDFIERSRSSSGLSGTCPTRA